MTRCIACLSAVEVTDGVNGWCEECWETHDKLCSECGESFLPSQEGIVGEKKNFCGSCCMKDAELDTPYVRVRFYGDAPIGQEV